MCVNRLGKSFSTGSRAYGLYNNGILGTDRAVPTKIIRSLYNLWFYWNTRSSSFILFFPELRKQLQWSNSFLRAPAAVLLGALTADQLFQGAHTTALLEHVEQRLCGADSAAPLELLSVLRGEQKEGTAPSVPRKQLLRSP